MEHEALRYVIDSMETAIYALNSRYATKVVLRNDSVQGVLLGRKGSEMGAIIEHDWRSEVNYLLTSTPYEMSWMPGHEYNDTILLTKNVRSDHYTRDGEIARYEVKTLNLQSDEPKAHFDPLISELTEGDKLLVLTWKWEQRDALHVHPRLADNWVGSALEIARMRDTLHIARGGTFVDRRRCPDNCLPNECSHHGEPLNSSGKRERKSGPESRRSSRTNFAGNFGGMVRMCRAKSEQAALLKQQILRENATAKSYVEFLSRNEL